jgi:hypothetical protein
MTLKDLDDIEAQADSSVPYYVPALVRELRKHLAAASLVSQEAAPRLPAVGGDRLERTLADFERACLVCLDDEQRRPNPDNALIAVLCDAVRLAREQTPPLAQEAAPQELAQILEGGSLAALCDNLRGTRTGDMAANVIRSLYRKK